MTRDWREAMPKWAVQAAIDELAASKRRLALRWPDEARPTPVPFQWGEYDRLEGTPVPGQYWRLSYDGTYVNAVYIREKTVNDPGYKPWWFSDDGERWTTSVQRGPLYATEREAKLAALWNACDEAAAKLEKVWQQFTDDRGYL